MFLEVSCKTSITWRELRRKHRCGFCDSSFVLNSQQLAESDDYEREHDWPEWLLTFEAWCAMTLYDETKVDGGEAFQKLMLLNNENLPPL